MSSYSRMNDVEKAETIEKAIAKAEKPFANEYKDKFGLYD